MRVKRILVDMLIIIKAQQEVLAQNTYNSLHRCTEVLCKIPTLNHYKTCTEAFKRFIDKEGCNLIQLQGTGSINNKPESSQHFTKGLCEPNICNRIKSNEAYVIYYYFLI